MIKPTIDKIPVFLCYRRVDGSERAEKVFELINNKKITLKDSLEEVPVDVFFDIHLGAVSNWTEHHKPALEGARSMILIITPGIATDVSEKGHPDWVQKEINWWSKNRKNVDPILIDCTGHGVKYLPRSIKRKWKNINRIPLDIRKWENLNEEEQANEHQLFTTRILDGIRDREGLIRYEDWERLTQSIKRYKITSVLAGAFGLVALTVIFFLMRTLREVKENALVTQFVSADPGTSLDALYKIIVENNKSINWIIERVISIETSASGEKNISQTELANTTERLQSALLNDFEVGIFSHPLIEVFDSPPYQDDKNNLKEQMKRRAEMAFAIVQNTYSEVVSNPKIFGDMLSLINTMESRNMLDSKKLDSLYIQMTTALKGYYKIPKLKKEDFSLVSLLDTGIIFKHLTQNLYFLHGGYNKYKYGVNDNQFWISIRPVTCEEAYFLNPFSMGPDKGSSKTNISWYEAYTYATLCGASLPTADQWQSAWLTQKIILGDESVKQFNNFSLVSKEWGLNRYNENLPDFKFYSTNSYDATRWLCSPFDSAYELALNAQFAYRGESDIGFRIVLPPDFFSNVDSNLHRKSITELLNDLNSDDRVVVWKAIKELSGHKLDAKIFLPKLKEMLEYSGQDYHKFGPRAIVNTLLTIGQQGFQTLEDILQSGKSPWKNYIKKQLLKYHENGDQVPQFDQ
jgi:hypothetical protein